MYRQLVMWNGAGLAINFLAGIIKHRAPQNPKSSGTRLAETCHTPVATPPKGALQPSAPFHHPRCRHGHRHRGGDDRHLPRVRKTDTGFAARPRVLGDNLGLAIGASVRANAAGSGVRILKVKIIVIPTADGIRFSRAGTCFAPGCSSDLVRTLPYPRSGVTPRCAALRCRRTARDPALHFH
jgi:hypothetical protein